MARTYVTNVTFQGYVITTTVTSSGDAMKRWVDEIRTLQCYHCGGSIYRSMVVGLDVEWRPSYGRGENPVATLQICVERRCLIVQLLHADYIPAALADFLAHDDSGRFCFYGVGVKADAERLSSHHGLPVADTVDLRDFSARVMNRPDLRQAGLSAIVAAVMGVPLVKPHWVTMSNWDAQFLTDEQVSYACIDAFVSCEVAERLIDRNWI